MVRLFEVMSDVFPETSHCTHSHCCEDLLPYNFCLPLHMDGKF
jgi:hypothetical protein